MGSQVVDPAAVSGWALPEGSRLRSDAGRRFPLSPDDRRASAPRALPVLVPLPAEIDISNVVRVGADLHAAIRPRAGVVVADMSLTEFCDSSGVGALVGAWKEAQACGCDLRVVVPSKRVLRVLEITGVAEVLPIFPSLGAALTAEETVS